MRNLTVFLFFILIFKAEAQSVSNLTTAKIADSLFEIGEYNKAIALFKEKNRFQEVAKSYEAIGNNKEAQKYYKKAISQDQENPKLAFAYSKVLFKSANYHEADSILQNLELRFPDNPNFVYERGLIREAQKDSTAIDLFLKVHSMYRNNMNASYRIARKYVEERKFEEATPFIEKALILDENSLRFLTLRALKQFYTQDYHNAIVTYSLLIAKGKSYASLHENLAIAYSQTLQDEKALEQYNILFQEYDDQNPKWYHEVAVIYRTIKEYKKAERHLNIAIGLLETPLSKEYLELSYVYGSQKDYKSEMKALLRALVNNPNNEIALYNLAVAADNSYKDKKTVLGYYDNYLNKHGETGRMRELAKHRRDHLIKEIHFSED